MLPSFTLSVDGLTRTTSYRDNGGTLKDAVIWCHGMGGTGEAFIEGKIVARTGVIDYGPNALDLAGTDCPKKTWVGPGETWPSCVPNNETDVKFINALVAKIKTDHSGIRIWMAGFSSGCKMSWNAYGYNGDSNFTDLASISGFGLGSHGMPNTWDWMAKSKTAKPTSLWYGTSEDDPSVGSETYQQSITNLGSLHGCTGQTALHSLGDCCSKDLKRQEGTPASSVDLWHFRRVGGIHVWSDCANCHEDNHFVGLWTNNGFGT